MRLTQEIEVIESLFKNQNTLDKLILPFFNKSLKKQL